MRAALAGNVSCRLGAGPAIQPAMILLRHGQSEFNVHFTATRRDPGIVDPRLTPLGEQQAEAAAEALAGERISRIIASPYTRTLQTAAIVARRIDVPVLVNPIVRERYAFTCDIGTPRTELALAWPGAGFLRPSTRSGGRRSRRPAASILGRAALFPRRDGGPARLVGHAGRHPLGLHPGAHRAARAECARSCAATRPRPVPTRSSGIRDAAVLRAAAAPRSSSWKDR